MTDRHAGGKAIRSPHVHHRYDGEQAVEGGAGGAAETAEEPRPVWPTTTCVIPYSATNSATAASNVGPANGGTPPLLLDEQVNAVASQGANPLLVCDGNRVAGLVVLEDVLKPHSKPPRSPAVRAGGPGAARQRAGAET